MTLLNANALHIPLADQSVHCVVTSVPYWGKRDYGEDNQLGLEPLHDCLAWARGDEPCGHCYICQMRSVFAEVWRVLRDDGTCWVNISDTYCSKKGQSGHGEAASQNARRSRHQSISSVASHVGGKGKTRPQDGPLPVKAKSLLLIPSRFALALQVDGWVVRSDIPWIKTNGMPESVKDRPVYGHEYIFLLAKSPRYYFNTIAVERPAAMTSKARAKRGIAKNKMTNGAAGQTPHSLHQPREHNSERETRDMRRWRTTDPLRDHIDPGIIGFVHAVASGRTNHFASFPDHLPIECILAGCPEKGIVLDPFVGSGTTLLAAHRLGRHGIGLDLSYPYLHDIAAKRLQANSFNLPLFPSVIDPHEPQ